MSLPGYAEYKGSGVAWLGDLPAHWQARPLKYLAKLVTGLTPPTDVHENYAEDGFPWIRPEDLNETGAATLASKFLSDEGAQIARILAPLSTLICCIGTIGKAGIIGLPAATNQQITAASFRGSARYFYYATCAARTEIETSATGNVLKILNTERLGRIGFPDPPEDEQSAIAAFLDRETGKIDALIAEQEKLLTLLAEKRQATISHAVTRGLNPNAPMKDSGVPWLGEVPAHWDVVRTKDVAKLESGHTPSKQVPEYWENCDIPWVSLNDSKQLAVVDYISETAFKISAAGLQNSSARMLPSGTVVFTRDATIGLAAITTTEMAVSQHLIAWCPSNRIDSLYLLRVFNFLKPHLDSLTFGATIKTIGMGEVKRLVTPLPPVDEQREIVQYIADEIAKLDDLRHSSERAVDLLKERRSAMIAAAVTGKIDVRQAA